MCGDRLGCGWDERSGVCDEPPWHDQDGEHTCKYRTMRIVGAVHRRMGGHIMHECHCGAFVLSDPTPPLAPDTTRQTITATLAATLRQIAQWGVYAERGTGGYYNMRDELYRLADWVTAGDFDDVCPMCEEVECDDDCPLRPVRNVEPS